MGYEFLLSGLPELTANSAAPMSDEALLELLRETLKEQDLRELELLDMQNNNEVVLDLLTRYDDSIIDQPIWWDDVRDVLSEEDLRSQILYEYGRHHGCRFVREWYAFNQDVNNVMAATVCRKHGFDVRKAIVGTNEVAAILRKNPAQKDFGLAAYLDNLNEIIAVAEEENLMERERKLDALRFIWLEDRTRFVDFSIENVLAYRLQTKMLNRWVGLTLEEGEKIFRELVADMKKGIKLDA